MLSLDRQEVYRQRYARMNPDWQPSSQVYQKLVRGYLTPDARVLDLGCGRGGVMERLHPHANFVAGLDSDLRSLREHREPSLAFIFGRAESLPCKDNSFDLVCCSWVLEHLPSPERAFAEVARVLVPGGRFVFLTPNVRHPLIALSRILGWTQGRVVEHLYGRKKEDIFPAWYRANTVTQVKRLARAAGVECRSLCLIGDPTYLAFNEPLFRLACLLERITPKALRVHLVGELQAL